MASVVPTVIVLVAPVPLAVTPAPTKLIVDAAVDNEDPSSCIVIALPPPPPVEAKVIETVKLLQSNIFPKPSSTCEYCNYLKKRWNLHKTHS